MKNSTLAQSHQRIRPGTNQAEMRRLHSPWMPTIPKGSCDQTIQLKAYRLHRQLMPTFPGTNPMASTVRTVPFKTTHLQIHRRDCMGCGSHSSFPYCDACSRCRSNKSLAYIQSPKKRRAYIAKGIWVSCDGGRPCRSCRHSKRRCVYPQQAQGYERPVQIFCARPLQSEIGQPTV